LVGSIFGKWGLKCGQIKGLAPIEAPSGAKGVKFGEFRKCSSHELAGQIH